MLIKLMFGIHKFQAEVFTRMQEVFESLAKGQNPGVLFITCADSRLMPELLTQINPGEFFTLRNVGNIVPLSHIASSEKAGIVYALQGLHNVKDIIICGHSDCGAMKGLLTPNLKNKMPEVAEWLTHSHSVLEQLHNPQASDLEEVTKLNILIQMEHLKSYPAVAKKLANNELTIHGWLYQFEKGEVLVHDSSAQEFMPFEHAFTQVLSTYRDKLVERIAMNYLEPLTHPQTVKEYKELMGLFSLLENNLLPIWPAIQEKVTNTFWAKLEGPHSIKDENEFTTLLEQGCQLKLPNLKDFQKNVMESAGYQQYMRNTMRHTLFAPTPRPMPLPITINLPSPTSLNLSL